MPIFGLGRKNSGGPDATPRMLPGDGDPVSAQVVAAVQARDWTGLRAVFDQYSGGELSTLVNRMPRDSPHAYSWLRSRYEQDRSDPVALTALGVATINHGWQIRTGSRAKHVSQKQFESFHAFLREAEDYLYQALELDPDLVAAWTQLLVSGRGLEVGPDIIERRFEAVVSRSPDHRPAHQQMLQALCRKWGGSHERMHAFAAKAAAGPHAVRLAHLVPTAHLENWLDLPVGDERRGYMHGGEVRAQLAEAAQASIFQGGTPDEHAPYYDANLFAMTFSLAGMPREAERAFALTEGVVTRFPWMYGNSADPVAFFALWRTNVRRLV